jgi:hypothetical protein
VTAPTPKRRKAKREGVSVWVVEWRSEPLRLQSAIAHRSEELAAMECGRLNDEDCDDSYYVAEYVRRVPAPKRRRK